MKIHILHLILCLGNFLTGNAQKAIPTEPPNIIFILTDDQRWSALGYAGNELAYTPAMDDLAANGLYFKNAMVTTPICSASRATILTGLHERTHRYDFQTNGIRDEFMQTSYPRELRNAGYYTGFYGKLGVKYDKEEELFDVMESYDRNGKYKDYRGYYYKTLDGDTVHLTRYTGQRALDFIEQAPHNKPFCLSLSFSAPHAHDPAPLQYFWQEASDSLLAHTTIPDPELAEDTYFDRLPKSVREGFNRLRWHWRYDTPEKYQHSVKGYYRMIAGIDREIAAIREKLKETGQDQNTVIILMGDNGYFLGERQLAGKWLMYDNSVRVPLIIYDPRNLHHQDIDQMAMNIDIPSTILDLAGGKSPAEWQGKSLVPFLTSGFYNLGWDTVLIEHLWEFENIPPSEGLRTSQWKYMRYINDKSIEELYNLTDDHQEINNQVNNPHLQDKLKKFSTTLDRKALEYQDPFVGAPTRLMVEFNRLRSLKNAADTDRSNFMESRGSLDENFKNESKLASGPVYSWKVPDGAGMPLSFQILVASSREKIDFNIGDIWDSGEVVSSENSNIVHQGLSFKKGQRYFWKVRIWDDLHRLTDYSMMQSFSY